MTRLGIVAHNHATEDRILTRGLLEQADKSFVVGWIDDVDEYRVQLDLELAFCILLYSSHLYL